MKMGSRLFPCAVVRASRIAATRVAIVTILCAGLANQCAAQVCAQLSGATFTENFNTLATSGSSNTAVPFAFAYIESGGLGDLTYAADNGSNSGANTYSYGTTGSTDRALGEITSA